METLDRAETELPDLPISLSTVWELLAPQRVPYEQVDYGEGWID